ncbi:MAG: carbohydrate-binding family 9-like protein [Faecalimonas sp.]|nr:carbohydrate-binding family 9-like protein [Faecalimonas sp.]
MQYQVKRIENRNQIEQCEQFSINHFMWNSKQEPKAYGWMGYIEGEGLFVKMVCEETNPKREYKNHKDPVYKDSTMEVFLAFPEGEISNDCMYTNFEINSNGAMLANFGEGRQGRQFISDAQYEETGVKSTIEADKWFLEVLFPESYLNQICEFNEIKGGKEFYCNFYKIAESEEIQHFGSFSPIESATPNFHLPVCFAKARIL